MSACRGRRDGGSWRERPRSSSLLQYSSLHLNLNSLFMFLYWLSCLSRRRAGFRRGLCSRRHSIIACSLPLFPISASLRRPFLLPCFPASLSFTSLSSSFSFSAPLSHFILISPSTLRTPLSLFRKTSAQPSPLWYAPLQTHAAIKFECSNDVLASTRCLISKGAKAASIIHVDRVLASTLACWRENLVQVGIPSSKI